MQNSSTNTEINDSGSFLDLEDFVPIDPNWREKYYKKVLKKRVIAFLLDIFFSSVICLIFAYLILLISTYLLSEFLKEFYILDYFYPLICITCITMFLPLAIMESSKWKGTVGKRIMKIQITDNHGNPISFWRSLLRNVLKVLVVCLYSFIIPLVVQYFTYKKTGKLFHDKFSNTIIGERL